MRKRRGRGESFLWKLTFRPTYVLRRVVVTWIPSEEDRLSQKKKAGLVEAVVEEEETWCKAWWGKDQIELVGVQHVVDVGDDGGDVKDGSDVEDSLSLPCNPPIHWNVMSAAEQLQSTTFVLILTRISVFSFIKYLRIVFFSYFLTISFGFIGIFLTWYEVSIEYCLLLTVESKSQMSQWQGPLMNCPTQSSGRIELLSMIMVVSYIVKDITDLTIEFFLPKLLLKQLQRAINKLTHSCDQTIPIFGQT